MQRPFSAQPATPGEHADPAVNPDGGNLGWVVVDAHDVAIPSFGDGYMCEHVAKERAKALNSGRPGTDVPNVCICQLVPPARESDG